MVGSTVADAETGLQKVDVEFDLTDAETLVLGTRLRFYDIQVKGDDAKLYTGPPGTIRALANQITIGEPTP